MLLVLNPKPKPQIADTIVLHLHTLSAITDIHSMYIPTIELLTLALILFFVLFISFYELGVLHIDSKGL